VQDVKICAVLVLHNLAQPPLQLSVQVTQWVNISQAVILQQLDAL
jgi:hypothetical protein